MLLSLHGAGILSTHRFVPEQELILRVAETNRKAAVRVVGQIATEGELHTYGVVFLQENPDFWQMEFPPAPVSDEQPRVIPLECGSCGQRVEVASGQFEYDISQIHGGLTRRCAKCGTLTVWTRADGKGPSPADRAIGQDKPPKPQGQPQSDILGKQKRVTRSEFRFSGSAGSPKEHDPFFSHRDRATDAPQSGWRDEVASGEETADTEVGVPPTQGNSSGMAHGGATDLPERTATPTMEEEESVVAAPEPVRDPTVERRRRARAKVSFFACVKTSQFGLDIVRCFDMSKGGVGFRSRNPYKQEMRVQIAVPYAPEVKDAPAIFVSGRIGNVKEMDGMWRCGVEFLVERN